ncbi:MAG: ATP-dependent protease [Desulfobacterales bacterium C00003060]|nr:MAG: ATP-dependent protease [Desulfobacterales bacterium S3730MH5]OEU77266.1 MAG: ATP-dependent protease [Desulfobacterales bacterium C00003060]
MAGKLKETSIKDLRLRIDPETLKVNSTAELCPTNHAVVGQHRAIEALKFGIGMQDSEYNIYFAGSTDTGAAYIARTFLEEAAKKESPPPDWCYVYNFKEPDKPRRLRLGRGQGKVLKKAMDDMVQALQTNVPAAFSTDDYRYKDQVLRQEFENKRRKVVDALREGVEAEGFLLQMDPQGISIIPGKDGKIIPPEELARYSPEEKRALRDRGDKLSVEMSQSMNEIAKLDADYVEGRKRLDEKVAITVVGKRMQPILDKFKNHPQVLEYLETLKSDVLEHIDDFRKRPEEKTPQAPNAVKGWYTGLNKYTVNVLVDNSETKGAPVVYTSNPTYPALFGRIEREAVFGALVTDFTMIRSGALHEANGGYLVLKAMDILKWYFAWEALKRAVRQQEVKIEDMSEMYGFITTKTLKPEPIPLDVKLVITGDSHLYELLYIYDDRFKQMFKIKAHLDDRTDRNKASTRQYIECMARLCEEQRLKHIDRTGIARLIEYSLELTGDRDKMTLRLGALADIMKEANYWAEYNKAEYINASHVEKAIEKKKYRANLVEERVQELIKKDIFWVETDGYKVGQINGLSILQTGDYTFGKPGRITANVSMGKEGVITIDRESRLSGKIHTKGVIILTSYLREHFAQDKPLALTASLCFEQTYGMVDGDSASSAELFALLSAIATVPISQCIAVTGSVSQKGEIQPVGGVTRKIEGYFEICRHKGLTGKQGVIIPKKSVKGLMLKNEVVEAVKEGKFHIYPIKTVAQGIEILTGMRAGKMRKDWTYPKGTLFRLADDRLRDMAQKARDFAKEKQDK